MSWRKLGVLLLVLIFAATMVVGCGGSQDNGTADKAEQGSLRLVLFT